MEDNQVEIYEFKALNDKGDIIETLEDYTGFAKV